MTPPGSVNVTNQAKLVDYLTNYNGNLYIESTKLGFDHFGTSMMTHFGIKFQDHGEFYEVNSLESLDIALMQSVNFVYAGGESPHFLVDRLVTTGATVLYASEDDYQRIFAYSPDDLYKVISSSIVFGALKNGDSLSMKPYLMAEMINYFLGLGTTTDIAELFGNADDLAITSYPNPFSAQTNISFNLNEQSTVNLSIYDNTGRLVSNLINGQLPAGNHSATWNGAENSGRKVQNGLYIFKMEINGQTRTGKIVLKR